METNPQNNEIEEDTPLEEVSQIFSSQQLNIEISKKICFALEQKADEFNEQSSFKQVSLEQLKKVYRVGADICCPNKNKNQCALARVNMFLSMISGLPLKEITADLGEPTGLLTRLELEGEEQHDVYEYDISESWVPSDDSFSKAEEDIEKYDLNVDFVDANDLYLDDPLRPMNDWLED